jgi:hypothetical protein
LGNEIGDNFLHALYRGFVPNTGTETLKVLELRKRTILQSNDDGLQNGVAVLFGHEIHLVDQDKMRASGLFLQSLQHTTK